MDLEVGDKVSLIIESETHLGFSVLIDEEFEGLLYRNEVFQELRENQRITGYIKNIREDGKIDVSLQPQGFRNAISLDTEKVVEAIYDHDGFLPLTDKSSPEEIKRKLFMSKKAFKRAVGTLYKEKTILIKEDGLELIN
ncbi:Conserved virulence factor B [Polaribacter huanghezhanensis]|uniref:DNA-binding protein n=1 Tax=Polaribacter huanghezhanensis TaxID=1354726 RepID=UPI002649CA46|nr:DNA-binding protein [Polaribacter huanghezhanensis]WKD86986.1 Conserved virulence factor B [Polaribacter huanghezhanensis]